MRDDRQSREKLKKLMQDLYVLLNEYFEEEEKEKLRQTEPPLDLSQVQVIY